MSGGARVWSGRGRPASPLAGRSVVIDVPNWVGDQLIAMPTAARLIAAAAGSRTLLYVRPPTRRLWETAFPTARVAAGDRHVEPFASARRLRRVDGRFDVGITLRHSSRAKILLRLVARRAVGSAGRGGVALLNHRYRVDRTRHQLYDAAPLLASWGLPAIDPAWRMRLPPALCAEGERRLAGVMEPAGGRVIGVAPATGCGDAKRWPAEHFGALIARLDRGVGSWVVIVGPGEQALARELCRAAGRELPVLGADTDVAGLAGIIANLDLLVSNDSGPMHLAAFLDVPVVAVFGPTDARRTGPIGAGHRIVSTELSCAPCRREVCPLGHRRCLDELEVARVALAVLEVVQGSGAPSRALPAAWPGSRSVAG